MGLLDGLISAGANILGGIMSSNSADKQAEANRQMQLDFAQNALSWKAGDARRAEANWGINPLALLGAQTNSFSNVVGGDGGGAGVAAAGQDLGRAANALTDHSERTAQLNEDLLKAQIANVNSQTVQNQAAASAMAVKATGQTPGLPNGVKKKDGLYTTYVDPDGNKVLLPSTSASSSLQNMASWPSNVAIGADLLARNLGIRHPIDDFSAWIDKFGSSPIRGDVLRSHGGPWRGGYRGAFNRAYKERR
nr:MAG: DNA pilot protein [Microvirus sp.]